MGRLLPGNPQQRPTRPHLDQRCPIWSCTGNKNLDLLPSPEAERRWISSSSKQGCPSPVPTSWLVLLLPSIMIFQLSDDVAVNIKPFDVSVNADTMDSRIHAHRVDVGSLLWAAEAHNLKSWGQWRASNCFIIRHFALPSTPGKEVASISALLSTCLGKMCVCVTFLSQDILPR